MSWDRFGMEVKDAKRLHDGILNKPGKIGSFTGKHKTIIAEVDTVAWTFTFTHASTVKLSCKLYIDPDNENYVRKLKQTQVSYTVRQE